MMYQHPPKERYNYQTPKRNEDLERGQRFQEEPPCEADSGQEKKGGGFWSCCCKCCCWILIIIVVLLVILAILITIYMPKPPKVKMVSFDVTKSALYQLDSDNSFDIKIKDIFGTIEYKSEKLGDIKTGPFVVKKKDKTDVEVKFSNQSFSKSLVEFCLSKKEFPADIKYTVVTGYFGIKITRKDTVKIPCPKIPNQDKIAENLEKYKDQIPEGVSEKNVAQMIANKQQLSQ